MLVTGKLIRELREEQGISQQELARLAGISQAHIAKIESGKTDPRVSTVNKILSVLEPKRKVVRCRDIMKKNIVSAKMDEHIKNLIPIMKRLGISQVPVFYKRKHVGSIRESTIIRNMHRNLRNLRVRDIIDEPFPVVNANDPVDILQILLDFHQAVLVSEGGKIAGIVTKSDLLRM